MSTRAHAENASRQARWHHQDSDIANALDNLTWKAILHLPGVVDSQRVLLYRIKGGRLSRWDRTHQKPGCPHCPDLGPEGGESAHIFWSCPQAQRLWQVLRRHWSPLWTADNAPTLQEDKVAFFSLSFPAVPDLLWSHHSLTRLPAPTIDATIATQAAVNAAWRQHSLVVMHTLWRWRTSPDRVEDIWTPAHTEAVLCNALKDSLRDLRWKRTAATAATPHTAAAIQLIRDATPSPPTNSVRASDPAAHYLLYFDGGSRGNPGPGGSGAVMVKLTSNKAHAEVVFTSATAHPDPSTTNNQAEHDGLIKGLQAAAAHSWTPLSVIGDSMIIIRQMRTYTPPLNRTLQSKYAHARRLADGLGIKHWDHHPRAANKMADAAANLAMDTKTNSEEHHPTENGRHQDIATLLPGDIAHWREGHP